MPFPEFRAGSRKVLFFSRGRGRGHAAMDLEIVASLRNDVPDLDVRFVSYADGAKLIAAEGKPLIDLGLPVENSFVDTTVLAGKIIGWLDPDLVISHEEFAAMPAAKVFDKPTVFLTDWFATPEKLTMAALRHADRVLFLEEHGVFTAPDFLADRIEYFGPYLREFRYGRGDRARARGELGLPLHATILGVFPGSWRESATPLADLVENAIALHPSREIYVLWMAGDDATLLDEKFATKPRFLVREFDPRIDAIMVCCNAAITKSNRKSVLELVRLGIPNLSISWGFNPIDDAWVKQHKEVDWVSATNLSASELARHIQLALDLGDRAQPWLPRQSANHSLITTLTKIVRDGRFQSP